MDLSALGQQFGLSPQQMEAAVSGLAPVIAAGMKRSASNSGGLESIFAALQQGQQGSGYGSAADASNVVLGQIFGSKDVSRGVAQQVSDSSGVSSAILKKLLPIIAAYVISQMMSGRGGPASAGSGGGLGDILGSILGGGQAGGSGGLGDILGQVLGGGGGQRLSAADGLLAGVERALRQR